MNSRIDTVTRLNLDSNKNFVSPDALQQFKYSLTDHIARVCEAGAMLGVKKEQLAIHDESKWGKEEFSYYAQQFHGNKADPTGFSLAWSHHVHHNPHHWQYWLHPAGYVIPDIDITFYDNGSNGGGYRAFEMPEHFALEMVADWLGASYCYTGSWDMTEWIRSNWQKIYLHTETKKFVYDILQEIQHGRAWL